ncbi:MAG: prolyl-tRNA synthetase associated domain-containing protein [Pseudomonadota bacterium]
MSAARTALFAKLDALGIATTTHEHAAVFTVAESDALHRELPGGHTKNLFLKDAKGALFLLVAEAHTDVPMKTLHKLLGCKRLSFGKPELLMETLGVEPGSVTAFAVLNDNAGAVKIFIDATLMGFDVINCHPLTNTATTTIQRDDLMAFLAATGHEATVVDLTGAPDRSD